MYITHKKPNHGLQNVFLHHLFAFIALLFVIHTAKLPFPEVAGLLNDMFLYTQAAICLFMVYILSYLLHKSSFSYFKTFSLSWIQFSSLVRSIYRERLLRRKENRLRFRWCGEISTSEEHLFLF